MRKSNKFIILLCLVFFFRCSNATDPNILALVGSTHVTTNEFVDAYSNKLIQNQVKDSEFERERTLNDLIRTKLFAEAARSNNLNLDSSALDLIKLSTESALREALYEKIIGSKRLAASDSAIRQHFHWQHTEIKLRHLFHTDREVLDTIFTKVQKNPEKFYTFAEQLFRNEELKNSGGMLGWIGYNTLDPNLEETAFSIPVGIVHGPVRSSYGWHIIVKEDEKKEMIVGEYDYQVSKKKLGALVSKKQSQIIANNSVNDLMASGVSIKDSLVFKILEQINFVVFEKKILNNNLKESNKEKIINVVQDLKLNKNMVLATYPGGTFTVDNLLNNLRNSNTGKFLDDPIQAFYTALRDEILTSKALEMGLTNNERVQMKIKSAEDQYLAQRYLLSLSPSNAKNYFSQKEIAEMTVALKKEITVTIFKENMELLFSNK